MSNATMGQPNHSNERTALELHQLRDRILAQPEAIRSQLEPLIEDALEHAMFRDRILEVARDALGRYRLDLEMVRFDLEATRREHLSLVRKVSQQD